MARRELRALVVYLVLLALAAVALAVPRIGFGVGGFRFERGGTGPLGLRLGLDLQGGVHLVYEAETPNVAPEQMEGVARIIERRVNAFGVAEPVIQILGGNRLLVQLPGIRNIEEAKRLIGETAKLEFKERKCLDPLCTEYEDRDIGLTGDDLARAFPGTDPTTGRPVVFIEFNPRGARIFADVTARIAGTNDRIAIFLDQQELLAPVARQAIFGGRAFIEGPDFTAERVRTIAIQLESGRLPVPLRLIQELDVDATLGSDALRKSLLAGYVGLALLAFFLLAYYRLPGLVAVIALLAYGVITLAMFKLIPVTMTLAGLAGFVVSLGLAVDANILIFERMKEELRTGRTIRAAIDTGFSRAWAAIRDSNITTFIASGILFWFGSRLGASPVMGFAVTLFIGVAVSMFTALVFSRTLLHLAVFLGMARNLGLWVPVPEGVKGGPAPVPPRRS